MKKAVFLDRDGTINEQRGLVTKKEDIEIIPNVVEAIRLLNNDFHIIIITNQPQVARGLCTEEDVKKIHSLLIGKLEEKGAKIDDIFYCPHHPEQHNDVPDNAKKYRIECDCRKPKTGMIKEAAKKFDLDLKECYMIGDQTRDVKAGKDAGCKSILVKTGFGGEDGKFDATPDLVCSDLLEAAKKIVDGEI